MTARRKKDKQSDNRPRSNIFRRMLFGTAVSIDPIKRSWVAIALAVVLIVSYTGTRYQNKLGMEKINKLMTQLEVVKSESIDQHMRYMSRTREAAMVSLADSVRPGLGIREQPPYVLPVSDIEKDRVTEQ